MKKIENSTHYHNVLKFEELETALTVKEVQMNSNSVIEKMNIIQALKERFKQQENHNNQDSKFINDNDQSNSQSNSQSNQNSEQNQHSAVSHDRNCERYNQFFNQFLNNQSNNISFTTDNK